MSQAMLIELGLLDGKSACTSVGNANQWADKDKNIIQFDYDADKEADEWWQREGGTVLRTDMLARM